MNNIRELHQFTNRSIQINQEIDLTVKLAIKFDPFRATWITYKEAVSKVFSDFFGRPVTSIEISEIMFGSEHFMEQMKMAYHYCKSHPQHSYYGIFIIYIDKDEEKRCCWFHAKIDNYSLNARNYEVTVSIHLDQSEEYYSRDYALYVNTKFRNEHSMLLHRLSKREIGIFKLFAKGMTVKEIAADLYLSTHTIESHKQSIYKKLEIKGLVELGIMAERLGLV